MADRRPGEAGKAGGSEGEKERMRDGGLRREGGWQDKYDGKLSVADVVLASENHPPRGFC